MADAWIPVSARLPDDDLMVMVALQGSDEPVWIGYHDADGWYYASGEPAGDCVTHWMPMPEGPHG